MRKYSSHIFIMARPTTGAYLALLLVVFVGAVSGRLMGRIYGGETAFITDYPWMVSLQTPRGTHYCGGSLLGARWVITVAHCIYRVPRSRLRVLSGTADILRQDNVTRVERVFRHRAYRDYTLQNDIALLRLAEPVAFSEMRQPVTLPPHSAVGRKKGRRRRKGRKRKQPIEVLKPDQAVQVTGWGRRQDGTLPALLHKVTVGYVSLADCKTMYRRSLRNGMICAASPGRDSCQGDSGGPLVVRDDTTNGTAVLFGLTSWGTGCADPRFPGVYTDVARYVRWITKATTRFGGLDS